MRTELPHTRLVIECMLMGGQVDCLECLGLIARGLETRPSLLSSLFCGAVGLPALPSFAETNHRVFCSLVFCSDNLMTEHSIKYNTGFFVRNGVE